MTIFGRFTRHFFLFAAILYWASPAYSRPNFNIDSLSFKQIGGTRGCWGYVDPDSGKEYALICATNHLEIWDVTNPDSAKKIKHVAAEPGAQDLKQVRQYKNYAVAVNQVGGSNRAALQIIDMSIPVEAYTVGVWPGTTYPSDTLPVNGAHTVHIDGDFAYVGMNGAAAEWYIVDISNPLNPTEVPGGTYLTPHGSQSHDSYVKGDTAYIAFLSGGFSIVDITDRSAPDTISDVLYPEAFTHNCWPTEDHKYLFTTDELPGGHLRVWDIQDPANPIQVAEWSPPGVSSIIHNVQVKGDFLYIAYYTEGVEILDIEDPTQPVEVGHFDTAPFAEGASFNGCWDFFPYFPSGTLLAGNLSGPPGMWLLRFNETRAGKLIGRVVNWETGDPLPEAAVRYVGLPRQTKTDSSGNYLFRTEGGTIRLEFSLPNFRPETLTINAFYDSTVEVDTVVRLVPTSFLPSTPQGLTARPVDGGNIELFWQQPPDTDLVSFRLYRTLLSDTSAFVLLDSLSPAETGYTDVGGTAGERYLYRITAVNSLFESFVSDPVAAMRFVFGPKLLLVNRTGPTSIFSFNYFRDTIQNFYFRALRRYDFDTLNLKDESFPLPTAISPNFVTRNQAIFVHSAELYTRATDNPTFLSYFNDFLKAGGKLVMDGHWALGGINLSFLKCLPAEAPFSTSSAVWDTLRNAFGFDCLFFPRIYPIDTSLVNRSFLSAEPQVAGYPPLLADSGRAAFGVKAFISPSLNHNYPTVPITGYFSNRNAGEDLYSFGSISPGTDPKQGQTVAKKHTDPSTGGGFVWFNFPLFYMQEDSAKKAIRKSLADLGESEDFPKGDLDRDGLRAVDDVMVLLNWVFLGQPFEVFDASEADMNCDGRSTPVDVILLLLNVFPGQPLPCD